MTKSIVLDANLLILLVVGAASTSYIAKHKRLDRYSVEDFELLSFIIGEFDQIILIPHVVAEVSNLSQQISGPARAEIQNKLKILISTVAEIPVRSSDAAARSEFDNLGITDAALLYVCEGFRDALIPTLVTSDKPLADAAHALGYSVIDYGQFQHPL